MKSKKTLIWLCGIIVGILLLMAGAAFITYRLYFDGGITTDHGRWAEFGDYVSGISGILNVVAFVGLTIIIGIIEKESADRDVCVRAQELMLKKIQSSNDNIYNLYIQFQSNPNMDIVQETLEKLQPLMAYFYFLKKVDFLPQVTKNKVSDTHSYLFDASNIFHEYTLNMRNNQNEIFSTYREIYRRFAELEVTVLTDIAGDYDPNEEKTFDDRLANQRNNP
jgi:hypothetical protein